MDSKLFHEIDPNAQPVQDGAPTLKFQSFQKKKAQRIVCILVTSNAINVTTMMIIVVIAIIMIVKKK